jgi:hypothetical protein
VDEELVNLVGPFEHEVAHGLLIGRTKIQHSDLRLLGCKLRLKGRNLCMELVELKGDVDILHRCALLLFLPLKQAVLLGHGVLLVGSSDRISPGTFWHGGDPHPVLQALGGATRVALAEAIGGGRLPIVADISTGGIGKGLCAGLLFPHGMVKPFCVHHAHKHLFWLTA